MATNPFNKDVLYQIDQDKAEGFFITIWRLFGDAWFAMLGFGALGHQLHIPFLFKFGYWQSWLICFTLQALWPIQSQRKLNVKKIKGTE